MRCRASKQRRDVRENQHTGGRPTVEKTDRIRDGEAIREYIEDTDDDHIQEVVTGRYYQDDIDFETVKRLVDPETAQRLRLLEVDLDGEPYDLAAPEETDIYDEHRPVGSDAAVEPTHG